MDSLKEQQTALSDGVYPMGMPKAARVSVGNQCIYIYLDYVHNIWLWYVSLDVYMAYHTTSLGGCGKWNDKVGIYMQRLWT